MPQKSVLLLAAVLLAAFAAPAGAGARGGAAQKTAGAKPARPAAVAEGRSVARAGLRLSYALARRRGAGFVALVGDPGTGLGFHALPLRYRIAAARYRARNERPPWLNPVRFAVMADAARYDYWLPVANAGYRYGVFNPNDGVGTPFFAGYYGPAGGDDEPPTLFGRPYLR